jgi:hypothetical protein
MTQKANDELLDAFNKLNNDKALAKKFIDNPVDVLQQLKIDTKGLVIKKTAVDGSETMVSTGTKPAPVTPEEGGWTVCGSVGWIGCVSAGKLL